MTRDEHVPSWQPIKGDELGPHRPNVLLVPELPAGVVAIAFEHFAPGTRVAQGSLSRARDATLTLLREAEFVVGFPWDMDEEAFRAASGSVRLVHLLSAGHELLDMSLATRFGIPVSGNGGSNSTATAEHTVMLILAALRRFDQRTSSVKAGGWNDGLAGSLSTFELEGKTVGIVGMGHIGTAVVTRLRGFGVTLVYFSASRLSAKEESKLDLHYKSLEGVLDECDILTLHVPLTPQTRQLIGQAELRRMKRGAVLVNTARGGLVDEKALVAALEQGDLFYAAVDTLREEPPPRDSHLRRVDNLLITPHVAGHTRESWSKAFGHAALNVRRVMNGEPPLWLLRDNEGGANDTS